MLYIDGRFCVIHARVAGHHVAFVLSDAEPKGVAWRGCNLCCSHIRMLDVTGSSESAHCPPIWHRPYAYFTLFPSFTRTTLTPWLKLRSHFRPCSYEQELTWRASVPEEVAPWICVKAVICVCVYPYV